MNKTSALTLPHPGRHSPQAHPGHPPRLHVVSSAPDRPAPQSQPLPRSAFSAHGIWAPGVRLMRSINFASKALLISLLFALPLGWVSYAYFKSTNEAMAFAEKERLGAEYLRDIYPVLEAAQQLRSEAASGAKASAALGEARDKLRAAQAKLAATDGRLGTALDTRALYSAVSQALADADKASGGTDAVFDAHTRHVEALMSLSAGVADSSNLTLDPDIDSFYLMDAAVARVPDVVENTAKLRGLGAAVLRSGSITPVQQRRLDEFIPIAEFQERNMREGLAKAFKANPALKDKVVATAALADSEAFFALARKSVVEAQDFANPEAPTALLAAGNKAVASQYALAQRLMSELDQLLAQRIAGMRAQERTIIAVQVITVALALYFFYSFFLVTRGGLQVISRHLQEMATGDLRNAPYKPWGRDEPAAVITDLRQTYDALHTLIHKVRHSAGALHEASSEISSASADLGARTEQAAAALEEQASAMEEIGTTVGGTAQSAQQAAAFAVKNSQVAEEGGQVFTEVVTTMHGIRQSSSKIGDIISVIDGIAFQTNILALNAAVEAARAGEQGRGFAVVAAEVRTLAQRSAEAAKEIKELITDSVQRVSVGTQVVEAAGATMTEVVGNAQKINTLLGEIASSSQQQASGVEQVVKSVQDLDRNTQQNAALVEETSAAAAALNQQANLLQEELAKFQTA